MQPQLERVSVCDMVMLEACGCEPDGTWRYRVREDGKVEFGPLDKDRFVPVVVANGDGDGNGGVVW